MYKKLLQKLAFPIGFVILLWVTHVLQFVSGIDLGTLGVYPRVVSGLPGILTYPLIHGSWEHLFGNTVSFLMLSSVLFLFYRRIALRCFILLYLFSGLGIWIIAPAGSYHIGASGVVYGMVSLVFWSGVFRRNIKSIVLA
ncbi:MAG: rhomboid family intramembrane serine protease, partial [Bacteroidota bacterium]|nr:rhomboid family intramembrane serine protease [Bacteroidota bacterium]